MCYLHFVAAEIRPREITPGAFTSPSSSGFELRFSVEMVDGVVRLTTDLEEVRLPLSRVYNIFTEMCSILP